MKLISKSLVWLGALAVVSSACAQAPITFTDTPEAVRLYEARTLESLRENCQQVRSPQLFEREEAKIARQGFVSFHAARPNQNWYSMYAYDADKRSFTLVDGQSLTRGARLVVPLALPRDYSYCRIVRDGRGGEQLEVVHKTLTAMSDGKKLDRLLEEVGELAAHGPLDCSTQPVAALPFIARTVVKGKQLTLPACNEGAAALQDEMDRVVRRVQER